MAEGAENEGLLNRIISKLTTCFEELSFDPYFYETAKAHLKVVAEYFKNHGYDNHDNIGHKDLNFIVAKFFFLKHSMFPRNEKFLLEEVPLTPVVYLKNKLLKDARRKAFTSVLTYNDVLYLQVCVVMPDEYELQLISFIPVKSKVKIKLDDLELCAYLYKTPDEMKVLGGELEKLDLIRAVPLRVDEEEKKCYVTVVSDTTVALGRVSKKDAFVSEVLSETNCSSYREALDIIAPFKFPNIKLMKSFGSTNGLDLHTWSSFSPQWNAKLFPPDSYGVACFSEAKVCTSKDLVKEAEKLYKSNEIEAAFEFLKIASNLCQTNPFIYEVRGKMYYEIGDKERAAIDFEAALNLNPNTKVKELYSKLLFSVAMHYQKKLKNYEKAAIMLCSCLELNEKDSELFLKCLRKIKKLQPQVQVPERFANVFSRVEIKEKKARKDSPSNASLADLIKKRKKIKRKLGIREKE
ncbi:uncharacterized protein LOC118193430 isoform X2 [Stegodyphus dumicola]|uniref:uncharacterized protein LOC118193430 isoform X2 n=1 Tax=Stegodyphus dumicola TaxID=202533 RepID=UPI0015B03B21|nr:uncharacterized protein LOC118193430 isoform X2 [Stegodyphus dumicola]